MAADHSREEDLDFYDEHSVEDLDWRTDGRGTAPPESEHEHDVAQDLARQRYEDPRAFDHRDDPEMDPRKDYEP